MFNVREIIRRNNATFYDFDTQKKRSQKPRAAITCFSAASAALVFPDISDNFLAGFLTVQSILLGFTFNVMFFLVNNREGKPARASSIEDKVRATRLLDLYRELFYNISYFNLVAVVSIVIALLLLLPEPSVPFFFRGSSFVQTIVRWTHTSDTAEPAG